MSEEPSHKIDPSACLPPEMVTELSELLALAETVEPIVAELAARYHQLGRWDGAWPTDPAEPKALDARVLAASGDDRLRALLTTIAARAEAAIEGGHTPPEELDHHGLSGFELDEQAHPSCCRRSSQRAIAARAAHALAEALGWPSKPAGRHLTRARGDVRQSCGPHMTDHPPPRTGPGALHRALSLRLLEQATVFQPRERGLMSPTETKTLRVSRALT